MTRQCQSCGSRLCDGVQCYLESPADHPETEETISTLSLDELIAKHGSQLTECRGDPLLKKRRAA